MLRVAKRVAQWAAALLIGFMVIGAVLAEMSMHVQRPPGLGAYPTGTPHVRSYDGITLRGVFAGSGNRGCVLLLHGIGDTHFGMSGFSEALLAGGFRTLAPDSRGHGWSDDALVTYGVRESRDVSTWIDWLQNQGCTRIYGLGESLGSAVLLQSLARENRFRAVVADSAYFSFPGIAVDRLNGMLPVPRLLGDVIAAPAVAGGLLYARLRYGVDLTATSATDALRHTNTPVLLIDGLEDSHTPIAHSRRMAKANARVQLWEVAGANHCGAFGAGPIEFQRRVIEWFQ
jgi:pimeloyl-ACP methyl ester carboxylesterase